MSCPIRAVILVISTLLAPVALADVIHLQNGNEIQGEIVREGPSHVTVRFPGGLIEIQRKQIVNIERQSRLSYLLDEGEKHVKREDFVGALSIYQNAIEEFPDSERAKTDLVTAQETLAEFLHEARRLNEARSAYGSLLKLDPRHPEARKQISRIDEEIDFALREEEQGILDIRSGSIDDGYRRLRKIYERFPDRRLDLAPHLGEALIGFGNRKLNDSALAEAEKYYLEAISLHPDHLPRITRQYVFLKIHQLKPLLGEGKFDELLQAANGALELVPSSLPLNYFRALALEGLLRGKEAAEVYLGITGEKRPSNLVEALPVLRRAVESKLLGQGAREPTDDAKAVSEVLPGNWRRLKTEHFVVVHRNNKVAAEVARSAEDTYRRLYKELRCQTHWVKPCEIRLYPEKDDYLDQSGKRDWMGGSHKIVSSLGTLSEHRIETSQTQPRLAETVIPHEVAHAVFSHRLRYPRRLPLWLNEGFAIWVEPGFVHQFHRRAVSQSAQLGTLLKLDELVSLRDYPDDEEVRTFYAQSFSVVDLLIREKGLKHFLTFSEALSSGSQTPDQLFKRFYKISGTRGLENYWRSGLKR